MLFYTQNKFHLDRKYVKMKYKIKARNNGSVYFMFCLVFVFNIGVECASLSPKGQDNLKKKILNMEELKRQLRKVFVRYERDCYTELQRLHKKR